MDPKRKLPINEANYPLHVGNIAKIIAHAPDMNEADLRVAYYMAVVGVTYIKTDKPVDVGEITVRLSPANKKQSVAEFLREARSRGEPLTQSERRLAGPVPTVGPVEALQPLVDCLCECPSQQLGKPVPDGKITVRCLAAKQTPFGEQLGTSVPDGKITVKTAGLNPAAVDAVFSEPGTLAHETYSGPPKAMKPGYDF